MTSTDGTVDRLRKALEAVEPTPRSTEPCPEPERIWSAVHGQLEPDAVQPVVEHVAACPSCASDWRLAMRSDGRGVDAVADASPLRRPRPRLWSAGLAAAAAVLVVGLLAVFQMEGPGTAYRDAGHSAIRSLLPAEAVIARDRAVLRWTSPGDDAVYDVEVGTIDLEPLASGHDLNEPEFRVPAGALAGLPAGATIVWSVEARFPDGRREVSEAFLTRIE